MSKNHPELKAMLKQGGCWFLALMPYLPIPEGVSTREQYRHLTRKRAWQSQISFDRGLHLLCLLLLLALVARGQTPSARATASAPTYTESQVVPLSVDLSGALRTSGGGGSGGGLTDAQLRASPVPMSLATVPLATNAATESTLNSVLGRLPALVGGRIPVDGSGVTQPVSGTVGISGTVPVTGTFWQATQPVSGTVTANAGTGTFAVSGPLTDAQLRAVAVPVSGTFWQATQPISGTVTANAGTGTMAVNLGQVGGTNTVTGGVAGSQGVGGTGANNAAITQNPLLQGVEAISTQPTAATTGNLRQAIGTLDGAQYMRMGGPITWTCGLNAIAASLTQCQAAPSAGLSLYITSIAVQTTTATSGTYSFQSGTGANCGTGTTAVFPVSATGNRFNAPTTANAMANIQFPVPLKLTAAHALCMIGVATNTISAQVVGFTAP